MKYLLVLSNEMPDLAKEEVRTVTGTSIISSIKNLIILEIKNKKLINNMPKRLAYTRAIYSLLFESSYSYFLKDMENFDWSSVYKGDFCIRVSTINKDSINKIPIIGNPIINDPLNNKIKDKKIINNTIKSIKEIKNTPLKSNKIIIDKNKRDNEKIYSEKELAYYIWKSVKNPKVNLENPKTHIEIFFFEDKVLCCLLLHKLENDFQGRRSHLRPKPSPISLHPKLARAMVNLTGADEKDTILDPFCGSGGILIEAGLMGMKTIGYDINKKMVWKSIVNLKNYKIRNSTLKIKDFFTINKKYKYIVADLPYGLNTNIMENIRITTQNREQMRGYLESFYSKVVKKLESILSKRAVIIFPSYVNYKKIIKKSKLKIKKEFESYVHGNLTRKILILDK
jgi:tRNA (guanine10-N2)-dimethyltransferase